MHITAEQFLLAQAHGCRFVPATESQVHGLAMQRRIFWLEGQAFLAIRPDGFQETAATLQSLLLGPPPVSASATDEVLPTQAEGDEAASAPQPAEPILPAPPSALALTAQLVSSYVSTNPVSISDLPRLIREIHESVLRISGEIPVEGQG